MNKYTHKILSSLQSTGFSGLLDSFFFTDSQLKDIQEYKVESNLNEYIDNPIQII